MRAKTVYIATHIWNSPLRVGSHHIAEYLAKTNNLLYLSHPISLGSVLGSVLSGSDNQLSARWQLLKSGPSGEHTPANMLEMNTLMPFAPGPSVLQRNHISNRYGWKLSIPNATRTIRNSGFLNPESLWIDTLFQNYWVDLIKPRKMQMRIADHPEHIAKLSAPLRKSLYANLKRAAMVVTPTKTIAEHLRAITTAPIEVIPNGVNVSYFQKPTAQPKLYESETRPKIVFVGSLARWIDFDLLQRLADSSPHLAFYLIGPVHGQKRLPRADNLFYVGSIEHRLLSGYLQHADVALAPFDVTKHQNLVESADALKLYEYIAAGLPVVATRWAQSQQLEPLVTTTEQNAPAFREAIDRALSEDETHKASLKELQAFDWSTRLAQLKDC